MGRRDIDEPGVVREVFDDQALAIDADRNHPRAQGVHQQPGRRIARLLNGYPVPRLQEPSRDQVNGLLGAAGDDDRIRVRLDPP